jgi:hypothetical protein
MTTYVKYAGHWTPGTLIYVKRTGKWVPVQNQYVKSGGHWYQSYTSDTTPPPVPQLSYEIVNTTFHEDGKIKAGRYLRIKVQIPGAHIPDLRRIRVLTSYNGGPPSSQYGGNYIAQAEDRWPTEPWSDFSFNGWNSSSPSKLSNDDKMKLFPYMASERTRLPEGKHYFAAWAEDFNGNWSAGTFVTVNLPPLNQDSPDRIVREATFFPDGSGSIGNGVFTNGYLRQDTNPNSRGVWLYHNKIAGTIKNDANIRGAQIWINRVDGKGGSHNIHLFGHQAQWTGDLGGLNSENTAKVGELASGGSNWFSLTAAQQAVLKTTKGFGLHFINPNTGEHRANDFSIVQAVGNNAWSGALHVTWDEPA